MATIINWWAILWRFCGNFVAFLRERGPIFNIQFQIYINRISNLSPTQIQCLNIQYNFCVRASPAHRMTSSKSNSKTFTLSHSIIFFKYFARSNSNPFPTPKIHMELYISLFFEYIYIQNASIFI